MRKGFIRSRWFSPGTPVSFTTYKMSQISHCVNWTSDCCLMYTWSFGHNGQSQSKVCVCVCLCVSIILIKHFFVFTYLARRRAGKCVKVSEIYINEHWHNITDSISSICWSYNSCRHSSNFIIDDNYFSSFSSSHLFGLELTKIRQIPDGSYIKWNIASIYCLLYLCVWVCVNLYQNIFLCVYLFSKT